MRTAGQKLSPARAAEQGAGSKRPDTGGRELDRERKAIYASADLAYDALVLGRELEVGLQRSSSFLEELDGGVIVKWRDGKDVLAGEMQHGTARHQEHQ